VRGCQEIVDRAIFSQKKIAFCGQGSILVGLECPLSHGDSKELLGFGRENADINPENGADRSRSMVSSSLRQGHGQTVYSKTVSATDALKTLITLIALI